MVDYILAQGGGVQPARPLCTSALPGAAPLP